MRRSSTHEYERTHTTVQLRWFTTISLSSFFFFCFYSKENKEKLSLPCTARSAVLDYFVNPSNWGRNRTSCSSRFLPSPLFGCVGARLASTWRAFNEDRWEDSLLFSPLLCFPIVSSFIFVSLSPSLPVYNVIVSSSSSRRFFSLLFSNKTTTTTRVLVWSKIPFHVGEQQQQQQQQQRRRRRRRRREWHTL